MESKQRAPINWLPPRLPNPPWLPASKFHDDHPVDDEDPVDNDDQLDYDLVDGIGQLDDDDDQATLYHTDSLKGLPGEAFTRRRTRRKTSMMVSRTMISIIMIADMRIFRISITVLLMF